MEHRPLNSGEDTLLLDGILLCPFQGAAVRSLEVLGFLVIFTITETPLKLKYQPASKASLQECKCSVPFCLFTSVEGIGASEVVAWLLHPLETASPPACPQLLQRRSMSL